MSKKINYNKDESVAPVDRAIIVPNEAPNAVKSAKSSKEEIKDAFAKFQMKKMMQK